MLARVHVLLPYAFTIPEGEVFSIYQYELDGYIVRMYPPERSDKADTHYEMESVLIDGVRAFNADVLRIDFYRESFDRAEDGQCDPPPSLIRRVANDFLARLRYVTNASRAKLIEFPDGSWNIAYLNDEGSELEEEKGKVRGRGSRKFEFSFIAINKEVWNDIHSLEPNQPLPVWKNLLLDADAVLPDVGPAVVLTFTALEVFISKLLDDLASTGKINQELWAWINGRDYLKRPSIEERYDFLCRHLLGMSIKDNEAMWEQFKHLRKARNSFAHDGIAKVGNEVVSTERCRGFIKTAQEILNAIKVELPEELKWPEFAHKIQLEFSKLIAIKDKNEAGKGDSGPAPAK